MQIHRIAALLAVLVLGLFAIPASVSAHTASATCGTVIVANTPGNHPASIYQQPAHTLLYGPVGNGTYAASGQVQVRWPAWDNDTHYVNLTIAPCEQPTPTPSPSPSPSPSPTPLSCANTPNLCPQPTPTPASSPTPTPPAATPTPDPTPTPQLVTSPPDSPNPPTLPPTSTTAPASVSWHDAGMTLLGMVGLFALLLVLLAVWGFRRTERR